MCILFGLNFQFRLSPPDRVGSVMGFIAGGMPCGVNDNVTSCCNIKPNEI